MRKENEVLKTFVFPFLPKAVQDSGFVNGTHSDLVLAYDPEVNSSPIYSRPFHDIRPYHRDCIINYIKSITVRFRFQTVYQRT